ncbi:flippase-like domain-containing protein [bacterium]|nr:flippase-like domain-containing protein [bacterium]
MAVLLIAGVAALVSLDNVWQLLISCRLQPLLHAFLLFFLACTSVGWAWQILLRPCGYKLDMLPAMRLSLLGFFFNNLVPSGVTGEVYRVYAISQMGLPKVHAAASVFVERWSAFLALILATGVSGWAGWPWLQGVKVGSALGQFYQPLEQARLDYMLLAFLILLVVGFLGISLWLWWAAGHSPQAWERYRLGISVPELVNGIAAYFRCPRYFLLATLINLASPLLEGLAFSSIADALGMELSPTLFLVFTPIFRILHHLPITINALGTQEVASVIFWQPLGAAPEQAVAISVLIHVLKISISLLGGPLYFIGQDYRVQTVG